MKRMLHARRVVGCPRWSARLLPTAALTAARRWQSTTSTGLNTTMQEKGFRLSTPNFNAAELSASGAVDPEELAADIITESAVGVDFMRDVYGPWLVMTDDLQGELFVDHDRFVYYRPSNGLGYGIGKVDILDAGATGTAFTLQLESYTYQPTDTVVPQFGLRFDVTGMVKKVTTRSSDYTTFSLVGVWRRVNRNNAVAALLPSQKNRQGVAEEEEKGSKGSNSSSTAAGVDTQQGGGTASDSRASTGQFNAARLPVGGADAALTPFTPNAELQGVFAHVFPEHLRADSHLRRVEESKAAAHLAGTSSASSPASRATATVPHINLEKYAIGSIPGLYYIPDYISVAEEAQMLQFIKDTPQELKSKLTKRTVQEWGCTMCDECQKSFVSDANMPPWVQEALDMQVYDGLFTPTTFPNSVRIHEYQQGEGIGPHCDGPIYVPMVTVLSLASSCLMSFYPRQGLYDNHPMDHYNDTFKFSEGEIGQRVPVQSVVLEPRSLLIFSGEGYYHYPHGVTDKAQDDLTSDLVGEVVNRDLLRDKAVVAIPRTFRASITTRNLMTRCSHQPARAEYAMKRAWHIYNHLPVPQPLYTPAPLLPPPAAAAATAPSSGRSDGGVRQAHLNTSNGVASASSSSADHTQLVAAVEELRAEQATLRTSVEELKQMVLAFHPAHVHAQKETGVVLNNLSTLVLRLDGKMDDLLDDFAALAGSKDKDK